MPGLRVSRGANPIAALHQLRYFVEAARCGTITGAARNLHVTQSSVSAQILRLEAEYGTALLVRGARRVQPTPAGEFLLAGAEPLLRQLADIEARMHAFESGTTSVLRVGAVGGPLSDWLPRSLTEFSRRHPETALHVVGGYTTERLCAMVAAGQLDLAVGYGSPAAGGPGPAPAGTAGPGGYEAIRLADEDLVLALPQGHRLAGRSLVALSEVRAETFATSPPGYVLREVALLACRRAGFMPRIGLETPNVRLVYRFVAEGFGVGLVSRAAAVYRCPGGVRTVEIDPADRPRRTLLAAYPAVGGLQPPLAVLREIVCRGACTFYRRMGWPRARRSEGARRPTTM